MRSPRVASGRALLSSAAFAAAALMLAACGGGPSDAEADDESDAPERTAIRVVTAVDNAYFFVPVQQHELLGTWDDASIDVEVVSGTTPTLGQILAAGEADVSLGGGTTQAALREQGIEQTIVANNFAPWAMYVVVNDNLDAESVEDLRGANFGITGAGAPSDFSVHKIAQELGWTEEDYTTTSFGDVSAMVAGFRSGSVDVIIWMADTAITLEEEGAGRIIGDSADYVGETVLESFSVMDDFAAEHPEAVREFFEHYFETVERLQADPDLFVQALVEGGGYSETVATRLAELELPKMSADGVISETEIAGLAEGAAFSTGDRENLNPFDIEYVYWEDYLDAIQ